MVQDPRPLILYSPGFIQNDGAFATPERSLVATLEQWGYRTRSLREFAPRSPRHTFADYVGAAAQCIASIPAETPLGFLGHSMGGLIGVSLPAVAAARISALVVAGTPLFPGVTFSHGVDVGGRLHLEATDLPFVQRRAMALARRLGALGVPFPGRTLGLGFRAARRLLDVRSLRFPLQIWSPGQLTPRELGAIIRTSFSDDSFGALADMIELALTDGEQAGDVPTGARLANLAAPLLCIAGGMDGVAPPKACRALFYRAGSETKTWHMLGPSLDGHREQGLLGHVDLLTSRRAEVETWPVLRAFLARHLLSTRDSAATFRE